MEINLKYDKEIERIQGKINRLEEGIYLFEIDAVENITELGKTENPLYLASRINKLKQEKTTLEEKQKPITTNLVI